LCYEVETSLPWCVCAVWKQGFSLALDEVGSLFPRGLDEVGSSFPWGVFGSKVLTLPRIACYAKIKHEKI